MGKLSGSSAFDRRIATIASGQSLSDEIDLEGYSLLGIIMPGSWTAAGLSFEAAQSPGGSFQDLHDSAGAEAVVTAAASRAIGLAGVTAEALAPFRIIKIRSGTSAVPVNQAAARTLELVLKR